MDHEEKQRLMLQYKEAGTAYRSVDTRIWGIYALYFAANGGALALLFDSQRTLPHYRLLIVCWGLFAIGVGQMALIGHLQRYSDHFADLLRATESRLGISVHQNIRFTPPSLYLRGPQLWLSDYRARNVMQCFTIILCLWWFLYPNYKAVVTVSPFISKTLHEPCKLFCFTVLSSIVGGAVVFAWLAVKRRHALNRKKITWLKGD